MSSKQPPSGKQQETGGVHAVQSEMIHGFPVCSEQVPCGRSKHMEPSPKQQSSVGVLELEVAPHPISAQVFPPKKYAPPGVTAQASLVMAFPTQL
jgi:hypothetical protein